MYFATFKTFVICIKSIMKYLVLKFDKNAICDGTVPYI